MSNQSVAIVTGANRGLGLETCRQLAQLDRQVVLTARDETQGLAAAEDLQKRGQNVTFFPLDVSKTDSILGFTSYLSDNYEVINTLINNAGIFPDPPPSDSKSSILKTDPDLVQQGFLINTLVSFWLIFLVVAGKAATLFQWGCFTKAL
ncbi:MAG: SDR family NAD(P)-dependent oxidoreductase [Candidatus Thiodiazotropha sp.]